MVEPRLCGVDEAGRGPLAGAVFAAAVILDPAKPIDGLADSKTLSEKKRDRLAIAIREHAWAYAIASASVAEIDEINILRATLLAMQRAVAGLVRPDAARIDSHHAIEVVVDGLHVPSVPYKGRAVVEGDRLIAEISAASILAKTARDAEMKTVDRAYPLYGFAQHKGYGTAQHLRALNAHGPCPHHRRSFAPVRAAISQARLAWE
jgi:ribonuclease HII